MKKYLMTGMVAVAFAAAFTSCSNAEDIYNEEEAQQISQQQIQKAYEAAFIATFGQPAKDQQWGFDAPWLKAGTRANIDVNGNMWKECPSLQDTEEADVTAYVNMTLAQMTAAGHKYTETFPVNITDYYVTQVHCGTDVYNHFDGSDCGKGSSHMDNLQINETAYNNINADGSLGSGWFHVNNFNRGDDTDWNGNTLVTNSGTKDFAYHGSEDARYHNNWIAVDGADIDPKYAGYYYICFDFEAVNPEAYTNFKFYVPGINAGEWTEKGPVAVPGCWTVESAKGMEITYTETVWNGTENVEVTKTVTVGGEGTKDWTAEKPVGGNKVVIADDVHTDWIIRLVKAEPKEEETKPWGDVRIMVEDLNAKAENNENFSQDSDWDFNDVVFDVKFTSDNTCDIRIVCIGGVLPLTVAGQEVHALAKKGMEILGAVNLEITGVSCDKSQNGYDIPVMVDKGSGYQQITAYKGQPAAKFAVPVTTAFMAERVNITTKYPSFMSWVTTNAPSNWYMGN